MNATTFATNVDTMTAAISTVIDLAHDVINRPTFSSRLPHITNVTTAVDQARAVMIEGGNPIRAEVSMLLEMLGHIEAERSINEARADQWCMHAAAMLPMVKRNLLDAMALKSRRADTSGGHDFRRRG